jgi:hypothetical protein
VKVWRSARATYVERGSGSGTIIIPDHGSLADVAMRFRSVDESDGAALVYDDEGGALPLVSVSGPADASDYVSTVVDALREAIGKAKIPATVKAELRDAITQATGDTG